MLPSDFCLKTSQYGCLWTHLDPSNHIWDNLDPGAKFWVQGPFGPKFKNRNFLSKPYNMGVYGLAWTPAISFEVNRTLGAFRLQIKKSALFSLNSTIWVYGLAWPQQSVLSWFGPQIQSLQNGSLSSPLCQPSSFDIFELTFTHGCLYYNPLGSRSEQGRTEGPNLRVLIKSFIYI